MDCRITSLPFRVEGEMSLRDILPQKRMDCESHFRDFFQKFVELEKERLERDRAAFCDNGSLSAVELNKQSALDRWM